MIFVTTETLAKHYDRRLSTVITQNVMSFKEDAAPTIVDCLRQMFRTSAHSDFAIEVIPPASDSETRQTFSVHKCLIACRSNIPVKSERHIIHDTSPILFDTLLQFIYTDEASMTKDIVVPLLHLSRKLNVKGLEAECFNFLINRLTFPDVCMLYEEARLSQRDDVKEMCKEKITENPSIIQTSSFLTLSLGGLKELLSMDDLAVDESVVFNSVMAWARQGCEKKSLDVTSKNLREVLGDTVFTVRYIWLTDEFIGSVVAKSGLLDNDELSELLEIKLSGKFPSGRFLVQKRNWNENAENDVKILFRFLEIRNFEDCGFWSCDGDSLDAIALTVSKPILLCGVTLYGPRETKSGLYQVLLELRNGTECVQKLKIQMLMKKSSLTNLIRFSEPVKLFAEHKYDIVLRLKGPGTYYGALQNAEMFMSMQVDGCTEFYQPDIPRFNQDGVVFTFSNSQLGVGGRTDVHMGQIPEILYKVPVQDNTEKSLK
ncbi:BTB/POZ domain-containing protein 2-like [Liolophura sinensis]|uniref:BTB/POZ domain-containing protein 2-like n=1 Tax=Liolophura sinensis TaxID=3198878 RepID=UPI0031589AE2